MYPPDARTTQPPVTPTSTATLLGRPKVKPAQLMNPWSGRVVVAGPAGARVYRGVEPFCTATGVFVIVTPPRSAPSRKNTAPLSIVRLRSSSCLPSVRVDFAIIVTGLLVSIRRFSFFGVL